MAVGGIALATLLRLGLGGSPAPFITFYPFLIITTLVGGWRAGAVSVVLAALSAATFTMETPGVALAPADFLTLVVFLLVGATLVGLVALLNIAIDRLWRQSENVRLVLDTEPAGVIATDAHGRIRLVNKTAARQFGYEPEDLYGEPLEILVPDDKREGHIGLRTAYMTNPETRAMGAGRDLSGRRKDGSAMPIEVGLNPFERDGERGALATVIDISERKAAERRQQVLANEVRHRGRNLMTLVQAIASRLLTPDRPMAEARKDFLSALVALSRAQDLFLDTGAAPLRRIVDLELSPFAEQVVLEGCDIELTPRAAQDFALIVHELAANALKYGALSCPEGRIAITGRVDDSHFTWTWEESNGPPLRTPTRVGFGHTILNDVANQFGASRLEYAASGFRYELKAELTRITSNVVDLGAQRSAGT